METESCDVPSFSMFAALDLAHKGLPEECFFNFDVRLYLFSILHAQAIRVSTEQGRNVMDALYY